MPFKESNNVKIIKRLHHQITLERAISIFIIRRMCGTDGAVTFAKNLDHLLDDNGFCHSLFNHVQMSVNGYQRIN